MTEYPAPSSPPWGATTKLVVALTIVAIAAGLVIKFHAIIGPLLMAFVLAYLLSPVAGFLQRTVHMAWHLAVALIYVVVFLVLIGILTLGGVGLVQQMQSLISVVQANLALLPQFIQDLSGQVFQFGPFQIDLRHLDLNQLSSQLVAIVQPLLGGTGTLLSSIASGAAQFLGWALFIMLVSYFMMAESGGLRTGLVSFDVPGYSYDIQRIRMHLSRIWNAFLRGQIIIFLLTVAAYTLVFSVIGVRYALGIAFLAGLAKFVPYVGPFVTWATLALVAYFQPAPLFGLSPLYYALLAVALALLIDQAFDNIIAPRIIAQALRVHPAAVLVAALIAANLLGLLGVVVAAPMLATVALFWRYALRKMLDLDPFPEGEMPPPAPPASHVLVRIRRLWRDGRQRFTKSA